MLGQQLLEVADVAEALLPERLRRQVVHADDEHVLVVGAVEDGELALARRVLVDAPEEVVLAAPLRGDAEGGDVDAAGVEAARTCLMAPSLPALSRPWRTTSTECILAPQSSPAARRALRRAARSVRSLFPSSRPSADRAKCGRGGLSLRAPRRPTNPRRQVSAREQLFVETELRQVADAHWVEDAVEVVDLVLHHAGMEALHGSFEPLAVLVEARVLQFPVARNPAAIPGTDRQPSQPSSISSESGVRTGLMRTVSGTGSTSG